MLLSCARQVKQSEQDNLLPCKSNDEASNERANDEERTYTLLLFVSGGVGLVEEWWWCGVNKEGKRKEGREKNWTD